MKMIPVLFIICLLLIAGYVVTDIASVTIKTKQDTICILDSIDR